MESLSANGDNLTSSFRTRIPFVSFSCLISLAIIYIPYWIRVVRVDSLFLFFILEETLSDFLNSVWCWLWVCHIAFIMLRYNFSIFNLFRNFIRKAGWILPKAFIGSSEMIMYFILDLIYVLYYNYWFVYFEPSLHPRNELTWSLYMVF